MSPDWELAVLVLYECGKAPCEIVISFADGNLCITQYEVEQVLIKSGKLKPSHFEPKDYLRIVG